MISTKGKEAKRNNSKFLARLPPRLEGQKDAKQRYICNHSTKGIYVLAYFQTESKRIEQQGGYMFTNMTVPNTFNFGQ